MEKNQERQLTVSSQCEKRAWSKDMVVPKIRLSGKWLKEAGFKPSDKVKVQVKNKKLIITVCK